jgi:putative acetyltransferase
MYRIARETRDSATLAELVGLLDAELIRRNGQEMQSNYSTYNSLASVDAAVIAYAGEEPVGCGCFRRFDDSTAEIKRMFVRPEHRGTGLARTLLVELEQWAAESGYVQTILETGVKQVEAVGLYTKAGYTRTENYGQYVGMDHSVCMTKRLKVDARLGKNAEP